jgi:hypothetical protein
MIGLGFRLGCQ